MTETAIRDAWLWQAKICEGMGAPFTAALMRAMVEDEAARAAVAPILAPYDDPSPRTLLMAAMPLRILGGLHYAVLSGAAPELERFYATGETDGLGGALAEAAMAHRDTLERFMTSPPQTNEVRRSLCLVGGFLETAKRTGLPLRCLELGASAGLNMNWDRYAYAFGADQRWGPQGAAVALAGDWSGSVPPTDAEVRVVEKRACDQAPIDVMTEEGTLRLQAYIWPDQRDRLDRVRAAIGVARGTRTEVEAADAADWVNAVADPKAGAATVVYHSIFIQYPPEGVRAAIINAIAEKGAKATAEAPFAWLRMEPREDRPLDVEVRLTLWPGGEERCLAAVHPHGATVHWTGWAEELAR